MQSYRLVLTAVSDPGSSISTDTVNDALMVGAFVVDALMKDAIMDDALKKVVGALKRCTKEK